MLWSKSNYAALYQLLCWWKRIQTVSDFASDFLMEKTIAAGFFSVVKILLVSLLGLQNTMVDSHAGPAVYSFESFYHVRVLF